MTLDLTRRIERHFLTLAIGFSALGLLHPPMFAWIRRGPRF
jgi:BASS family bile acid:Na+ symporter